MIVEIELFVFIVVFAIFLYFVYRFMPKEERAEIENKFVKKESELLKWQPPKSTEEIISDQLIRKLNDKYEQNKS